MNEQIHFSINNMYIGLYYTHMEQSRMGKLLDVHLLLEGYAEDFKLYCQEEKREVFLRRPCILRRYIYRGLIYI